MDTKLRSEVATTVLRSSTHFNLLIVKITFKRLRLQVSTLLLLIINTLALVLVRVLALTPGGVLPYITYTGMCRPTGSWFWSYWFRTGYPFQRRFLERGIIFRTHESSSFVSCHMKLFKDRLLLKIRFNALTSKLLDCLHLRTEYKKLAHF